MRPRYRHLLAAVALAVVSAPARADDGGALTASEALDAECVAVLAADGPATPPERKAILQAAVFFFYGKLWARHPGLDLVGAMKAGTKDVTGDGAAERRRCYGELLQASRGMGLAGKALAPD